jgi:hypothetical protein
LAYLEKAGYRPASFVDLFEKIEPWKKRDPEPCPRCSSSIR